VELLGRDVQLNGIDLRLGPDDVLPVLSGEAVPAGSVKLAPLTITFLAIPTAHNGACR
jgi:hypothetical protein